MRLKRIYASKLYVTSTRKDSIRAAIQDPINAELVQQLAEYLDEDAQVELKQAEAQQEQKAAPKGNSIVSEGGNDSFSSSGSDGHFTPSGGSSFTGNIMDDFGEDSLEDIDVPETDGADADSGADAGTEAPEVVESVTQEGKPITAASLIWTTAEDVASECDTIQGTLNSREDTKGVSRMQVSDNELWIYFNDESNLNDKMIDVIEVLNSTGYTYLKFNRLARSNNAIVFDINLNTSEDIKSVKDIEEENK